ncbi:MAG: pseudouridine synthase [Prevotellaceae bacterium]|nr:pseudouridine synthase [Candidatus Colivivens equi]
MNDNEKWQQKPGEGEGQPKRQRVRFQRVERTYSSNNSTTNEHAFRPHGGNQQGGYGAPQGGYGNQGFNNQQGYRSNRPSNYSNTGGESGYSSQGSYGNRPAGNNRYSNQGGYSNRQGGYGNQQGGYSNRQGGYSNQQGGYSNRQGGYNNSPMGFNKFGNQGGYSNRPTNANQRPNRLSNYNPNSKYSLKKQIEYKEYNVDPNAPVRLNKFLANAGVCSRREADEFIQAGVITVNGQIVTELGTKVMRTDEVHFHDQLVSMEKKVYVLLNKPKDYVTTSDDPQGRKTVLSLVQNCCRERIYPVGRLDRNTTGVLLFTNDGELAAKLSHPKYLKKKVYHVFLDKNCTINDMKALAEGIQLEDGEIHADDISYASDTDRKQVGIEIHSGKNRIVRRMFEALGYKVLKLDRVMFAGLTKKGLKRGDWRFLTEQEVAMLHINSGN